VDDPEQLCRELSRVGKAGYVETPGWLGDLIMRESFHRWRVRDSRGVLVFEEVTNLRPLGVLGDAIYALAYAGRRRPGHPSLYAKNPVGRLFLAAVRYWVAALFRIPGLVDLIYLRHEWRDALQCRVVRTSEP
jgi:hypothetical protein